MKIAEIYRSVQGEGFLTGVKSAFVRASGCNLRCWYCDTPYASHAPEGEDLSVDEILESVAHWDTSHVVITGGEPMLFAELIPLAAGLRLAGLHVTIETAGTLELDVECDLMSISPKLSTAAPDARLQPRWAQRHERARHAPKVIRRLIGDYNYQFKFVIDGPHDCQEVEDYLGQFPELDRARVMLMPQGTDATELASRAGWLEGYCRQHQLHFCPRKHIEWFGLARGT
ncbi:MAG TPA: 7-carboxy-7-deazaguanine synthase QueE [Pirellulales bacterium]|nr:7-carboxy-7-deazaguanine synthase QueE [Pirellulales bacterium]